MLTKRQNLLETIRGGHPDRFVNQFEAFVMLSKPKNPGYQSLKKGQGPIVDDWGVTKIWPADNPGPFPVHTPDKIVVKDITRWKDYVKAPNVIFSEAEWEPYIKKAEEIDRNEYFATMYKAPGIFEQSHYLCEMQNAMINLYEEPDDMKDLLKYIAEYEIRLAEQVCKYLKPDALFHHDDWGSQNSTFMSRDMFEEFLMPLYKDVYGCYKENGVQLIVHHSDSYAETLVPCMIEMKIDIWQGVMTTNNIPELIRKYGGQISFMGGINSASIDFEGWTPEIIEKEVRRACDEYGRLYFIPGASQGGAISTYPGVYEATSKAIDEYSKIVFGTE